MVAIGKETIEQIKVVEWIKQCTNLPVIHIANERQTNPRHGALLKRMGVMPGVADLFIPRQHSRGLATWIEMKAPGGKLSQLQKDFLSDMEYEGFFAAVCYSADAAIDLICTLYNIKKPELQTKSPE